MMTGHFGGDNDTDWIPDRKPVMTDLAARLANIGHRLQSSAPLRDDALWMHGILSRLTGEDVVEAACASVSGHPRRDAFKTMLAAALARAMEG